MEQNDSGHSLILNKLSTPAAPITCPPLLNRGRYVDLSYMRSVAMKTKNSVTRTYSDPTTNVAKHLIKRTIFDSDVRRLKQEQQQQQQQQLKQEIETQLNNDTNLTIKETTTTSNDATEKNDATKPSNDYVSSDEMLAKPKLRRSFGKRPDAFRNLLRWSADDVVDSFTGEKVAFSVDSVSGEDFTAAWAESDRQRAALAALNKLPIWESQSLNLNCTTPNGGRSKEKLTDSSLAGQKKKPKSILVRKRLRRSSSFPESIHHNTSKGVKFELTTSNFVSCPSHVFPTEPYAVAFDMPFEDSDEELIEYPTPPTRSAESLPASGTDGVICTQPQPQQRLFRELEGQVSSPPNGARYIIVDSNPDDCLHCLRLTKEAVRCCTCVWCVQAGCYHCYAKDDVGDLDWLDNFGSCKGTRRQNCKGWGVLGALSLLLPCLMLYPPLIGTLNFCMHCRQRYSPAEACDKRT